MEILTANLRENNKGKSAKKVRRKGNVPGILYGKEMRNCMIEIGELELNREILESGEHGIIKVNIEGNVHEALIKEIQREPVTHKFIHIDLEEINGTEKVTTHIPINYIGEGHLTASGAVVQKEKSNIKVTCSPENLPKYITLDLSDAKVGSIFKLSDIEMGKEISIVEDLNSIIASVSFDQKVVEVIE
ncbi:50S ribosomal protein L25 [Clostridium polynesiense]|uniref:50S ribosomal protein L25 n=1 Tax=Clostridium polynesiense TaxID=1325933 RepID=UPI00058F57D6|nr:50S ribosomal protein L25 [Clostridium polynesiense]